jgi:hypothetical protein
MTQHAICRFAWFRLIAISLGAAALLTLSGGPVESHKKETSAVGGDDGRDVKWEGWTFTWRLRLVEGLVITDVHFRGKSVLKYAGLAEIFTPYDQGQPRK